jgi:hypothetical protein
MWIAEDTLGRLLTGITMRLALGHPDSRHRKISTIARPCSDGVRGNGEATIGG